MSTSREVRLLDRSTGISLWVGGLARREAGCVFGWVLLCMSAGMSFGLEGMLGERERGRSCMWVSVRWVYVKVDLW